MAECIVCKEKAECQKFLSCGNLQSRHKLCQKCVKKLAKQTRKGVDTMVDIECPICRTSTTLPDGDAAKLQSKFFLVDLICEDCLESKNIKDQWWCKTCDKTCCGSCAMHRHRQHECSQWENYSVPKEIVNFFKHKLDNDDDVNECQRKIKNFCQRLESTLLTRYIIETSQDRKLYANLLNSIESCFGSLHSTNEQSKQLDVKNFDKKLKMVESVMKSVNGAATFESNDMIERVKKEKEISINLPSLNDVLKLFDNFKTSVPVNEKFETFSLPSKSVSSAKLEMSPNNFVGKFKLIDSKNFDEYMRALGINAVTRTLANKASPTVEFIIAADETWTIKTYSTIKNSEINFKLGEEFDEITLDGRKCRTTFHLLLNGKLGQRQKATKSGEKDIWVEREIKEDDMIVTMPLGGITCIRTFRRQ